MVNKELFKHFRGCTEEVFNTIIESVSEAAEDIAVCNNYIPANLGFGLIQFPCEFECSVYDGKELEERINKAIKERYGVKDNLVRVTKKEDRCMKDKLYLVN